MDQSIATACESRREQYSGTGKRPVKFPPKNCDFRPCRAPGGAGKLANGCCRGRPARAAGPAPSDAGLPRSGRRGPVGAARAAALGLPVYGPATLGPDWTPRARRAGRAARCDGSDAGCGSHPGLRGAVRGNRAGYRYETERQPTVPRPARRRQTEYSGRSASRSLRPPCCRRGRRWCRRCRSCRRGRCGRCGGHNRRRDAGRRN